MAEQLVGVIEDALLKLKNTIKKDAEVSTCGGTVPQGIPAATSQGTPSTARQQATPSARQQTVFTAGVNRQLDSPRTSNSSGTFNISRLCSQFRGRGLKRKADVSSFTITKLILLNSKDQRYTLKKCILMAMSFLHGGPGPNFMSDDLYNQIIDGAIKNPQIHHVADPNVRRAILSLSNAKQIEELRNALLDDALVEANLATYATSLGQKDTFVKQALHYFVKVKVTPALQDICNGLESCGLLTIMRSHPNVLKEYFIPLTNPLTPKAFFNIFTIKRETVGSNKFNQESQALSFFSSFLHECEDKKAKCPAIGVEESVTIEDVLFFATGCDRVPPGGFTYPTIKFTHEMDEESDEKKNYPRNLPIANTCVISLYLPVRHTEFEEFRKFMILATNNKNRGFGFA